MRQYERRQSILKDIEDDGSISIENISGKYHVSKVTARTDLNDLEQRGLIVRTHGGAAAPENLRMVRLISDTVHERRDEKNKIADIAVELIEAGSTLIIDAGSTTSFISRRIKDMNLSVITNSLLVSEELSAASNIDLFISGGLLRRPSMAMIGPGSSNFVKQFHADLLFLGSSTISLEKGVSCTNLIEAETKRSLIKGALKVALLADSSKMGCVSLAHVCDWSDIDFYITDLISQENKERLEHLGVEVLSAEVK